MRISDWSSDVCSSDLRRLVGDRGRELDLLPLLQLGHQARFGRLQGQVLRAGVLQVGLRDGILDAHQHVARLDDVALMDQKIGQDAALQVDRKSVVSGKGWTVRVDLGGPRYIKKKNKK